jgi:hypothetical protein
LARAWQGEDVLGASDCEQLGSGWLVQPVNALSSLAFVPAGGWVAAQARGLSGWRRWEALGVGVALVANGIGSFAYHGTQPSWAKVAHDGPIVAIVALLAANEVGRRADHVEVSGAEDRSRRAGRLALVTGAAALAAYGLGRTGSPACRPASLLQWHAVWHVLAAVALASAAEARIERG